MRRVARRFLVLGFGIFLLLLPGVAVAQQYDHLAAAEWDLWTGNPQRAVFDLVTRRNHHLGGFAHRAVLELLSGQPCLAAMDVQRAIFFRQYHY